MAGLDRSQIFVTRRSVGQLTAVSALRFSIARQTRSKLGRAVATQEHLLRAGDQYRSVVNPDTTPLAVAPAAVLPTRQMGGVRGQRVVELR